MSADPATARRPRAVRLQSAEKTERETDLSAPPTGVRPTEPALLPVEFTPDPFASDGSEPGPGEQAVEEAQRQGFGRRPRLSWAGLFWSAVGGLVSLAATLWVTGLVEDAFARSRVLGIIGLALASFAVIALLVIVVRESLAVGRQRHIVRLHADIARAYAADDGAAARHLLADLATIYRARPDTAAARGDLFGLREEIVDGRDLIEIAERSLMAPLDARARGAVAGAAKRVSAVTALAPRAIVDVGFVLFQAVRLIRTIAEIYGGRPGLLGFVKLARAVTAHLAITGGMAAGDTIVSQLVGHGIAAKLSARLGEGVLNGLLTARIGLSAMAVCRPMPFAAEPAPNLRRVVPFLFRSGPPEADPKEPTSPSRSSR